MLWHMSMINLPSDASPDITVKRTVLRVTPCMYVFYTIAKRVDRFQETLN